MDFKGFVARLIAKDVVSKRTGKKLTAYSFKVEQDNGVEYDQWFDFGFDQPPFNEGDYISFSAEQNGKFWNYTKGSGTLVKNPPARYVAKPADKPVSGPTVHGPTGGEPTVQVAGSDRQSQIVAQHSQEIALRRLAIFLDNDALPMSEAKTKAGTAKRFEELTAMLHKFEVEAYNDVTAGRIATGSILTPTVPLADKKEQTETESKPDQAGGGETQEGVY